MVSQILLHVPTIFKSLEEFWFKLIKISSDKSYQLILCEKLHHTINSKGFIYLFIFLVSHNLLP